MPAQVCVIPLSSRLTQNITNDLLNLANDPILSQTDLTLIHGSWGSGERNRDRPSTR